MELLAAFAALQPMPPYWVSQSLLIWLVFGVLFVILVADGWHFTVRFEKMGAKFVRTTSTIFINEMKEKYYHSILPHVL